ncbi:MAG: hypothetical protein JXB47_02025 [Anaerolineae bacterium]|nr:hypothetical protein [Anaerolineae bacterium]
MRDYLTYRRMIVPILIQGVFWIGAVGSIVVGAWLAIQDGRPLLGILIMILGPLGVRVGTEVLMVVFRISLTLTEIKEILAKQTALIEEERRVMVTPRVLRKKPRRDDDW